MMILDTKEGDIGNLFNQSIDQNYYKAIRNIKVFHNKNSCIEYESKSDENKFLLVKEYFNLISPYLSHMIIIKLMEDGKLIRVII